MRIYQTPGVYHERSDASGGGIAVLRTDVAGFVGIAERGPLHLAVPVESQRQFDAWFGQPIANGYLAYSARGFFENGGRRVWVVRVASDAASPAALTLSDALGPAWRVEASSPGVWGNRLTLRINEVRSAQARGAVNAGDPRCVHLPTVAGLTRGSLLELRAAGVSERAVIESIDAVRSRIRLRTPLATISAGAEPLLEAIAYTVAVLDAGRLIAVFEQLSLVPEHPRYGPAILAMPWQSVDVESPGAPHRRAADADLAVEFFRVARNRVVPLPPPVVIRELRDALHRGALALLSGIDGRAMPLTGGADGLAGLTVSDFTGGALAAEASQEAIVAARRGIAALAVDEIGVTAVPDIHIRPEPVPQTAPNPCVPDPCLPVDALAPLPALAVGDSPPRFALEQIYLVQARLVEHCETRRDRVALLDAPLETVSALTFAVNELRDWRQRFDSAFAALYAPWIRVVDPLRMRPGASARTTRAIPPSGHVAGLLAATDLKRGVHVPPANVALAWVQDVVLPIDDERHGLLNALGVDVIRALEGRGLRVMGARTLSSDTSWRFLNVRRLVSMVERAIEVAIAWAVFEANDWRTRTKLSFVVGSFLRELWSRGALVGSAVEEAFFVRCDETNNPPDARDRGQLLIEVGLAPVVPLEFIVLRIGRDANGFSVNETDAMPAPAI
jgi:phage tail sheath protein FI